MSKKVADESERQLAAGELPFFAHLLSGQDDPMVVSVESGGTAPTYHCLDSPCTKKYPSDGDESSTGLGDRDF